MKSMFRKMGLPLLAVILAAAASAFTAPKKADVSSLKSGSKYWYEVDRASQTILQNTPMFAHADKTSVLQVTDCPDDNTQLDCLRGFDNPQNTSLGDISDPGSEQIKEATNP